MTADEPPSSSDDLPMCPECYAILDDDGTCPDVADHDPGDDLLALWSERNTPANILVIVPTGTHVFYIESDHTDEVRILDANALLQAPILPSPLGVAGDPFGVPVFKAVRMGP